MTPRARTPTLLLRVRLARSLPAEQPVNEQKLSELQKGGSMARSARPRV